MRLGIALALHGSRACCKTATQIDGQNEPNYVLGAVSDRFENTHNPFSLEY